MWAVDPGAPVAPLCPGGLVSTGTCTAGTRLFREISGHKETLRLQTHMSQGSHQKHSSTCTYTQTEREH